jgi:hypothetical protein
MQRAAAVGEKAPVGRLVGLDLGGLQDVGVAVVQKAGHRPGGVGGEAFDALAGPVVEGLDGVAGGRVAHLTDGRQHRVGHRAGLPADGVAKALGHGPGHQGQQQQRQYLDDDEDRDQLAANPHHPALESHVLTHR